MKQLLFDFDSNLGGISRMFAIPVSSYHRLQKNKTNNTNTLLVKDRSNIIDLYIDDEQFMFSEDYERGAYNVQVSGSVPKTNPVNQTNIAKLESEFWYLLFEDNNGYIRLAGNEDNQLEFMRTDTTGNINTKNQIQFTFYGSQSEKCKFIDLISMDDL